MRQNALCAKEEKKMAELVEVQARLEEKINQQQKEIQ